MRVKLHNNQSPMRIRFCCISLEIVSRARRKWQDSATVHKAKAGSDYTASLTRAIILSSTTLHSFSSTQQQMQKSPPDEQYMELETAGKAAVKFGTSVQDYTEVLFWDCHSTTVAHSKSRTQSWVVPHCSYSFLVVGGQQRGADLLFLVVSKRTHRNGMKLCQGKLRLDIRRRYFTQKVAGHRLPKGVAAAPNLSVSNEHLENALSDPV